MDLYRLRALLAAPLASLFLVLVICGFVIRRPVSAGIHIPVIRNDPGAPQQQPCPNRSILLRLTKDGRTWINETELSPIQIAPVVAEVTENRSKRVVYVLADSEVSYGQFAEFLDKIVGSTTDLHVALISGEMWRALGRYRDPCAFVFPASDFAHSKVTLQR